MDLAVKANEKMYRQMEHDAKDEEKIETARKMKECHEPMDKIKFYTRLSSEKIKSICL